MDQSATLLAYPDMTIESLNGLDPDIVVSPLMSRSFDCFDVATRLTEAEFTGQLRVLTQPLPQPDLVAHELRSSFPALQLDVLVVDEALITACPTPS